MKLFVWNSSYRISFGGCCLYVVADTVEHARELARAAPVVRFGLSPSGPAFGDKPLGEPTRVVDLPGGECYEWEE